MSDYNRIIQLSTSDLCLYTRRRRTRPASNSPLATPERNHAGAKPAHPPPPAPPSIPRCSRRKDARVVFQANHPASTIHSRIRLSSTHLIDHMFSKIQWVHASKKNFVTYVCLRTVSSFRARAAGRDAFWLQRFLRAFRIRSTGQQGPLCVWSAWSDDQSTTSRDANSWPWRSPSDSSLHAIPRGRIPGTLPRSESTQLRGIYIHGGLSARISSTANNE
jgi:hypothetical protein